MKILILLFKVYKRITRHVALLIEHVLAVALLKLNGAVIGKGIQSRGVPCVDVTLGGRLTIGEKFAMNNGKRYNKIGRQQQCLFVVGKHGQLSIGNHVGVSSATIVCQKRVVIGDFVKIGGDVVIYDTDFHSLEPTIRNDEKTDVLHRKCQEVIIEDNVFIGAHSIILKGVHIGENSIIGAGSVVTRSIPGNEIWAGNPAKFIRALSPA